MAGCLHSWPVWGYVRERMQHQRQLLGARAVQRDDGVVHVLRGVVGGGLLEGLRGCAGMCWRRGVRGRWAWAVRQRDVLVLGWVRGIGMRAVLAEPVWRCVWARLQHQGQLLGARAVQRDDGVVHVLRGVVGGGLLEGVRGCAGMCWRR